MSQAPLVAMTTKGKEVLLPQRSSRVQIEANNESNKTKYWKTHHSNMINSSYLGMNEAETIYIHESPFRTLTPETDTCHYIQTSWQKIDRLTWQQKDSDRIFFAVNLCRNGSDFLPWVLLENRQAWLTQYMFSSYWLANLVIYTIYNNHGKQ